MRKIRSRYLSQPAHAIFTEATDYFSAGPDSIWGRGEQETLALVDSIRPAGIWLDLAAGDGRYAVKLVPNVRKLVAVDIDPGALSKLWYRISEEYRNRVELVQSDLTQVLPFRSDLFDGTICTGTLHLFSEHLICQILTEVGRVTRKQGKILFDFAVDFSRQLPDGSKFIYEGEHSYSVRTASELISGCLHGYKLEIQQATFEDDMSHISGHGYVTSGQFLLIEAQKQFEGISNAAR
jgi:ubiquinone/menaquinone biosynthesis C-methylase UbiE